MIGPHLPRRRWVKVGLVVTFLLAFGFLMVSVVISESREFNIRRFMIANMYALPPLELCPRTPPSVGRIAVDRQILEFETLNKKYPAVSPGGHYKPTNCTSHNKTAIIVAYRDREKHLRVLINNLIPFLVKQQSEFVIFVVEPVQPLTFNRALLMNVGFVEALKTMNFTCFFFHDVDLIPVHDQNLYRCHDHPRHMSVANSKFHYRLPYGTYAGGVIGMSRAIYQSINGQSNLYFGWGGEDDDLAHRLKVGNYTTKRHSVVIGRYEALDHKKDKGNPINTRRNVLLGVKRHRPSSEEGLNTLKYNIVKKEQRPLYTWILLDVDMEYYQKAIDNLLQNSKKAKTAKIAKTAKTAETVKKEDIEKNKKLPLQTKQPKAKAANT